jgi:hypothetical protein
MVKFRIIGSKVDMSISGTMGDRCFEAAVYAQFIRHKFERKPEI